MNSIMNFIERWFLRRAARRGCVQGYHFSGIEEYFDVMVQEARSAFIEDTKYTLDAFLRERLDRVLDAPE